MPIYGKLCIIPCQSTLMRRRIVVIAFILENDIITENSEAMCKTTRDKELTVII